MDEGVWTDGMLNQDHPDDERLSALASRETDATADVALTAHVASCDRCTGLVQELGALRTALADLPDLRPSRPLQLVPPADASEPAADRLGGWARRFFAPVLVSGAALALVGVVGTAAPALSGMASSGFQDVGAELEMAEPQGSEAAASAAPAAAASADTFAGAVSGEGGGESAASPAGDGRRDAAADHGRESFTDETDASAPLRSATPERSPWPMVLFAGIALIVAALLMRWVLAPRAG